MPARLTTGLIQGPLMMLPWAMALLIPIASSPADDPAADYLRDVRPTLQRRCSSCHGALQQKGGLRLDTAEAIRAGGESGPAVALDDPPTSLLVEKITDPDSKQRMPPEGDPLSDAEIAAIRAWIAAGAPAPEGEKPSKDPGEHWAFRRPVRPAVPPGSAASSNPIDAFLDAERQSRGLTASTPVEKDLLLRRVALDLVGLPPTRAELHAFRADDSVDAFEKVVDRLLANPGYGERWGRHWMDIWRYSDWYGLGPEPRFSHYHIWRWRDWIIESLNSGTGYDRMIIAMLAGDEVAPDDPDLLRATGFLARHWDTFNRNKWLDTTVEHTSRAFLGITLQCARCHDHKFDPIGQNEYYQMKAVFEPYQIRIDRIPGQPDRNKAGLARAFDDYLDKPTHLFVRGEETQPDTSRPQRAAAPAVLGGTLHVEPVALPVGAYNPDKREFVISEARESAARAVDGAAEAVKAARAHLEQVPAAQTVADESLRQAEQTLQSSAKPEDQAKAREAAIAATDAAARARRTAIDAPRALGRAEAAHVAAEAAREALAAVLVVERFEDEGMKESGSMIWADAARTAVTAQRKLEQAEATVAQLAAQQSVEHASVVFEGLIAAASDPKDESLKPALAKANAALVDARAKLAAAESRRTTADTDVSQPPTTDYKPRALEFPRAKVTYRDTPSNAPYARTSTGRRLALARWIVDRGNPLTARVAVNHIWARHFGEPLVPAVFDFGMRSPRPVHHELLDWLAVEFMESGWDMKRLHRLIVTSQAYQMRSSSAVADDPNRAIDPDNHYFWRMNPRRMEAEVIRDSLLHLADRLDCALGGPDAPVAAAEEGLRRTIYYRYARGDQMLFLTLFDAPNIEECYRRHETIVPQQALALTNSKLVFDRADEIARAIGVEVDDGSPTQFVSAAFERLLGRIPTADELAASSDGLERLAAVENIEPAAGPNGAAHAETSQPAAPASPATIARDRARAAFIHVLLNHNDFVTIR